MAIIHISLPMLMKKRIEKQENTDPHSNASEHLHELVEREQNYTDKREKLVKALIQGENSGISNHTIGSIWKKVSSRHNS